MSRFPCALRAATDTAQIILMDGTFNKLKHLFEIADDFEDNMQSHFISSIISGVICIGGARSGLWAGMAISYAGIVGGHAP
jgi:Cu2+-exporting ATPase